MSRPTKEWSAGDELTSSDLNSNFEEVWGALDDRPTIEVFTVNGTWNRPAGITRIIIELVGGGGAGGGIDNNRRIGVAGGGGGGYAKKILDVSAISSLGITVGSGGSGNRAGDGDDGGDTEVKNGETTIVKATGGKGALKHESSGGAGGIGTEGDILIKGQGGGSIMKVLDASSGVGGSSCLGGGGEAKYGSSNGADGGQYGGGGSGSVQSPDTNDSHSGGDGADGVVIITNLP